MRKACAKTLAFGLLETAGVAVVGPDFGILGEGHIRLSYAISPENLGRALARIATPPARAAEAMTSSVLAHCDSRECPDLGYNVSCL